MLMVALHANRGKQSPSVDIECFFFKIRFILFSIRSGNGIASICNNPTIGSQTVLTTSCLLGSGGRVNAVSISFDLSKFKLL